ncbi:PAAR domain-containing protein [Pseudomonas benzenivorans]|uniref:PAAR domain-containing protein n=1 Tax=Pseudomonas benzenivorans TaxID=556533 RepID=UPI00384DD4D8
MSGKPAARLNDPTACPIPGHGSNPIAAGSPDVLFDSLPAARMGDPSACGGALASAVIPTVLINGKPATTIGTVGSHGNVVVGGSGTVLIGTSGGGAAFSAPSAMPATAAATPIASTSAETSITAAATAVATALIDALIPAAQAAEASSEELDYQLSLKRSGNRILTPLQIPDFKELTNGSTENSETIDFLVSNRKQPADSLTLEVLDGSTLLYAEPDTSKLLPTGEHLWQWDGYSQAGVLDTKVLKSPDLKVRLTATKGGEQHIVELSLSNEAEEIEWVDARIDRSAQLVEITVRPSFSDGGVSGTNTNLTAKTFTELQAMAKAGIERYWSRDGSRAQGVGAPIQTAKGVYKVKVVADVNTKPSTKNFPLISSLSADFGRSTSFAMFKKIYHNQGFWSAANYPADFADGDFEHTAAHEVGHLILNEYGDGGLVPEYSWSHKETSTVLTQSPVANHPVPGSGEVDVMHYHSDSPRGPRGYQDYWNRAVASEQDVKGLLWLSRVQFDD